MYQTLKTGRVNIRHIIQDKPEKFTAMGFNVSGLVINKNYKSNFEDLQKELGWNLKKEGEINFETASSNWKEDGICDVYFSEKGTLMFISMDMCAESWPLKNANTLAFALSETSMAFNLNYCEDGVLKRSIMEVEDNRMAEEGEKLAVEEKSEDTSEIIWNQIEVVLGKSFWSIDLSEKAERYVFSNDAKQVTTEMVQDTLKNEYAVTKENDKEQAKKWWKFW